MPTLHTKYSFPSNLVVTDKMVFDFIQCISYDMNKEIIEHFNAKAIKIEHFNKILEDLVESRTVSDRDGWNSTLYFIVSTILMENDYLRKEFKFVKLDEEWDDEGRDRHYLYKYVSTDKIIKDAEEEIKRQIKILKTYGKTVTYNIV